jgi:hypothetical protein
MDRNQIIINAAKAIKNAMVKNSAWHIGKHTDGTPALDIDALYSELADGRMIGWVGLKAVDACTLGEWSGAVEMVIREERNKQENVDRFDVTNKYDK